MSPIDLLTDHTSEVQGCNGSVLLAGDFNARTGTLPDFCVKDE